MLNVFKFVVKLYDFLSRIAKTLYSYLVSLCSLFYIKPIRILFIHFVSDENYEL